MASVHEQLKALGDPIRLDIVKMLAGKELCVCEIIAAFQVTQPTISHHLKVLRYAKLVLDRKEGKWIYYRLNNEAIAAITAFFAPLRADGEVPRSNACSQEEFSACPIPRGSTSSNAT
jgi:ArsR family transcriptional regulator